MARFTRWANTRLFNFIAGLDDEAHRRDRSALFDSIRYSLNHLLAVDRLWSARIRNRDPGIRSLDQLLSEEFDALWSPRAEEDEKLVVPVDGLSEADVEARFAIEDSSLTGWRKRAQVTF